MSTLQGQRDDGDSDTECEHEPLNKVFLTHPTGNIEPRHGTSQRRAAPLPRHSSPRLTPPLTALYDYIYRIDSWGCGTPRQIWTCPAVLTDAQFMSM